METQHLRCPPEITPSDGEAESALDIAVGLQVCSPVSSFRVVEDLGEGNSYEKMLMF